MGAMASKNASASSPVTPRMAALRAGEVRGPVAMMTLFAFLFVSQTVSADGSLSDVYAKSYQLAEQTYEQSANVWNGKSLDAPVLKQEPIDGTTAVSNTNTNN